MITFEPETLEHRSMTLKTDFRLVATKT